ncbi:hypothetical protein OEZ71_13450 [Defluviimonas sp. WL0050]|uniref:Uncharacterized protein n=1 Tax=Albidovulum litorale TaxID=2984134 RepID=A0ABT2ZQM7_9RHOB|nr:hypothetical protein [Defluviimonas sp. WL0050]MCV2873299.1 hypothetical protein [Defluviimonas sp. WL0050]
MTTGSAQGRRTAAKITLAGYATAPGRGRRQTPPTGRGVASWSHDDVIDRMVEALRWLRRYAPRAMGRGMVSSRVSRAFLADEAAHAEAGWGLIERADGPEPDREIELPPTPRQISGHERALTWLTLYVPDPELRRVLAIWLGCKAHKRDFRRALEARGIPRASAYRYRDRALTMIAGVLSRSDEPKTIPR